MFFVCDIYALTFRPLFSWIHACVAVDTVTGFLSVVINGKMVYHDISPTLVGSQKQKPSSLEGKLLLGAFEEAEPWLAVQGEGVKCASVLWPVEIGKDGIAHHQPSMRE